MLHHSITFYRIHILKILLWVLDSTPRILFALGSQARTNLFSSPSAGTSKQAPSLDLYSSSPTSVREAPHSCKSQRHIKHEWSASLTDVGLQVQAKRLLGLTLGRRGQIRAGLAPQSEQISFVCESSTHTN